MNKSPTDVLAAIDAQRTPRPANLGAPAAPLDAIEQFLVSLWIEVLRVDGVGTTDNFFQMGGDSIHLTQIASRLQAFFQVEVPFATFFEDPTIAGVSKVIRSALGQAELGVPGVEHWISEPSVGCEHLSEEWVLGTSPGSETISWLVVPTSDRPNALTRCLRSYIANLQKYGHACRMAVVDDSTSPAVWRQNQEIVQSLARSTRIDVRYYGPAERQSYAAELVKSGIPPETATFALEGRRGLFPGGSGAPRNLLQLITAGEAFASVDDDTECLFARRAEFVARVEEADGHPDPAVLSVYSSRAELLKNISICDLDFISAHHQLLGRQWGEVGECVKVTLMGVAGDCGWGSPSRYFDYSDQLTQNSRDWTAAVASREMLRASNCYTVSARAELLMTTAFAAVGRELLPPFPPVGRGADVVFGKMMKIVNPAALFGHLPWGVLHTPARPRRFWPGEHFRSAGTTDIATMLSTLLPEPTRQQRGAGAFSRVATSLWDAARMSNVDFEVLLNQRLRAMLEPKLQELELKSEKLRDTAPDWAADAVQYAAKARARLEGPHAALPVELLHGRDAEQAVEAARRLVALFGDLVAVWPEFMAVGQRLK